MKKILTLGFILGVFFNPTPANALIFSEVMYDPDGADTGREWVEIYNDSQSEIDLTSLVIVEGETRHRISAFSIYPVNLPANSYAVVADKPENFLSDYPNTKIVLDSAFSLSNSGETLTLSKTETDEVLDSVSWSGDSMASGGKSWQKSELSWISALATPGDENADREEISTTTTSNSNISTHSSTQSISTFKPTNTLKVSAGRERLISPRVTLEIKPSFSGSERMSFRWSWGDGDSSKGKIGRHSYRYPGEYAVVLSVKSAEGFTAVSRTVVTVEEPMISVNNFLVDKGFLKINNKDNKEVNIGGFILKTKTDKFVFPEDTIVLAGKSISVPVEILRFSTSTRDEISMNYPDGQIISKMFNIATP